MVGVVHSRLPSDVLEERRVVRLTVGTRVSLMEELLRAREPRRDGMWNSGIDSLRINLCSMVDSSFSGTTDGVGEELSSDLMPVTEGEGHLLKTEWKTPRFCSAESREVCEEELGEWGRHWGQEREVRC